MDVGYKERSGRENIINVLLIYCTLHSLLLYYTMKASVEIERAARDTAEQTTTASHDPKIDDSAKRKDRKVNNWGKDTMVIVGVIIGCMSVILAVLAIMVMVMLDMRTDIRQMQEQVYTNIPNELQILNTRIDDTNKRIDDTNKRIDALQESMNERLDTVNERIDTVIELLLANQ